MQDSLLYESILKCLTTKQHNLQNKNQLFCAPYVIKNIVYFTFINISLG